MPNNLPQVPKHYENVEETMSSSSSSTPPAADNQTPITHYNSNTYAHRGRNNGTASYYSRYSNNNSKRPPGPKSYTHQPFQSSHHQIYQSSHHQHHHNQHHSYSMNHHSHPANQQHQLPDENLVRYLHNAWTSAVSTGSIKTFHESADTSSTSNSNTATIFDLDSWFKKQSKSSSQSSTSNSVWNSKSKS